MHKFIFIHILNKKIIGLLRERKRKRERERERERDLTPSLAFVPVPALGPVLELHFSNHRTVLLDRITLRSSALNNSAAVIARAAFTLPKPSL